MTAKADAIDAIYAQVAAPGWAAPNLDGLADVLRDLSWLPVGPVHIAVPALDELADGERATLLRVLTLAVTESIDSPHPIRLRAADG